MTPINKTPVTATDLITILSNERRQEVVMHLHDDIGSEDTVELSEIAEYLAGLEYGPDYSSTDKRNIYVALHQTHINPLVDAGILDEVGSNTYRPGRNVEAAAAIVQTAESVTGDSDE